MSSITQITLHTYTLQIRGILNPPVKTRYQELIENLKETTYESFWKKELGKPRDNVPGLPAGMIPETFTFGSPVITGNFLNILYHGIQNNFIYYVVQK